MIEPNCDMPWEVYLDWLQDQGNEDLREMECCSFVSGYYYTFRYFDWDNLDGGVHVNYPKFHSIGAVESTEADGNDDGGEGEGDGCFLGERGYGDGGEHHESTES